MMEGLHDIGKGRELLAAVAVIILIAMLVMVFVFPDENGTIRTDLRIGDFYTHESETTGAEIRYEIIDIDGDTLTVERSYNGEQESTYECGIDEFLSRILLDPVDLSDDFTEIGISIIKTFRGQVLCHVYKNMLSTYHVDEVGVVYHSTIGGVSWQLTDSSLFIGYEPKEGSTFD